MKYSLAFLFLIFSTFLFLLSSCKKINEATELGSNLLPAVDNITTFDTVLNVETYNGIFNDLEDSARSVSSSTQFIGNINNDPLFGKTEASSFLELKPGSYKYLFPFTKENLVALDSVVLVLGIKSLYGDTTLQQSINVYELATTNTFRHDSTYLIRKNNFTIGSSLASAKTFIPKSLKDSMVLQRENIANQLRIPLLNSFGQRLLNYDTTNAYASDSAFKTYFNGFAIVPQNNGMANGLIGYSLLDTNTRLNFYVRYMNSGQLDTSVVKFTFTGLSAAANYIKRDYSGAQIAAHQNTTPDNLLYIQNTPGTYAKIKIPGLANLSNRIVHRAELIVEQVYDPSDALFTSPPYLFLDAYDSSISKFRTVPFDFSYSPSTNTFNASDFGMIGKQTTDVAGNPITRWTFNVSRYVQHIANKTQKSFDLRLSSPYVLKDAYNTGTADIDEVLSVNPFFGAGRVRVGGGNHAIQQMKLRIIYSKL